MRALKRENEALKSLGMDTTEIQAKISRKTAEYKEFCGMCGINPKTSRLRYECGTSDLKKTEAWKKYGTMDNEKKIDLGRIKAVRFEKTANKTIIQQEDVQKVQDAIAGLSQEYDIHLDYFEVGNYTDSKYINAPLFFRAIDDNGTYKSKLVINNACPFWMDLSYRDKVLRSGYFAGDNIEDFVEHELAHVMTFQSCATTEDYKRLEATLHPMFTNGVSRYSWNMKDGAETIAEAFVRIRKGKQVSKDALKLLDKYTEVWKYD